MCGPTLTTPRNVSKRPMVNPLEDSYQWIPDNTTWADGSTMCGNPGKGRMVLLCGNIDELARASLEVARPVSIFHQARDEQFDSETAVVYLACSTIQIVALSPTCKTSKYMYGRRLFKDISAWPPCRKC